MRKVASLGAGIICAAITFAIPGVLIPIRGTS